MHTDHQPVISVNGNYLQSPGYASGMGYAFHNQKFFEGTYTITAKNSIDSYKLIRVYDYDGNIIEGTHWQTTNGWTYNSYYRAWWVKGVDSATLTFPNNIGYWKLGLVWTATPEGTLVQYYDIQVEKGSTATAYEPFVGASDSYNATANTISRNIKEKVLTGQESVGLQSGVFYITVGDNTTSAPLSNVYSGSSATYTELGDREVGTVGESNNAIWIRDDRFTTVQEFKNYLQSLYSAGDPVIIWYALTTPITETIN